MYKKALLDVKSDVDKQKAVSNTVESHKTKMFENKENLSSLNQTVANLQRQVLKAVFFFSIFFLFYY